MAHYLLPLIVVLLSADYLLERYLDYLNSKNGEKPLPPEIQDIYDPERYRKSRDYEKANSRFRFFSSSFSLIILVLVLMSGGFAYLEKKLMLWTTSEITLSLLFFGLIFLASDFLGLPFSVYQTFVIEERFGFNRTTWKTFILDKIKSYLIGGIVGGALLGLFVFFYGWAGQHFWIYAWALFTVFMIFMSMFYASWIVPLFNKLTPLPDGELRSAIEDYCRKAGFKLNNLFVMDGSKRSAKANAFFSGLGAKKKIVLFDTLVSRHSTGELVAVLAHEVGHYKLRHTMAGLLLSVMQTGVMLFLLSFFLGYPALSSALGGEPGSFRLGLLAFGMLYSPISMITGILTNMLSRKFEYQADHYAAVTYNGALLKDALKKLSSNNLSNLLPHPAYVFFHYSHPTLLQRLKSLGD